MEDPDDGIAGKSAKDTNTGIHALGTACSLLGP